MRHTAVQTAQRVSGKIAGVAEAVPRRPGLLCHGSAGGKHNGLVSRLPCPSPRLGRQVHQVALTRISIEPTRV